jgi:hypothetical protein
MFSSLSRHLLLRVWKLHQFSLGEKREREVVRENTSADDNGTSSSKQMWSRDLRIKSRFSWIIMFEGEAIEVPAFLMPSKNITIVTSFCPLVLACSTIIRTCCWNLIGWHTSSIFAKITRPNNKKVNNPGQAPVPVRYTKPHHTVTKVHTLKGYGYVDYTYQPEFILICFTLS